ncbi:hypothetical protein EG329_002040 [Mollisiaceae sp. DMI_Dod_QoI]|nr:hypothetical protein EG329_002040 [Helotiales sp. DMI_Dod_QoI]
MCPCCSSFDTLQQTANPIVKFRTFLLSYSHIPPTSRERAEPPSDEKLWKFPLLGLVSATEAYFIVDALDEMELISSDSFLQRLNLSATFRPKSVMTSKPKQYLHTALRDTPKFHISLEDSVVVNDITFFVARRLKGLLLGGQSRHLRAGLEPITYKRSRGQFRMLDFWLIFNSYQNCMQRVNSMPRGSLKIYKHISRRCMLHANTEPENKTAVQLSSARKVQVSSNGYVLSGRHVESQELFRLPRLYMWLPLPA